MSIKHRRGGLACVIALALTLAGCGGSSGATRTSGRESAPAPSGTGSGTVSTAPRIASADQLYVSIGDSYAAGFQASGHRRGHTTRNGFAYQVVPAARKKGYRFTLVNFGCSGATTASVLRAHGCAPANLGPGAASYGSKTQAATAEDFLRAHRGKVGLITVSLGGNDVTSCSDASDIADCLLTALTKVKANLATLLTGLRAAAGPSTQIIGTTYPDVFLGAAATGSADGKALATQSVLAFQVYINPALKTAYEAVGGTLVDVTKATGAYGPLTATTTLPPYGAIPTPVARICQLTYYCQFGDIHPRTKGYAIIAGLVVGALRGR